MTRLRSTLESRVEGASNAADAAVTQIQDLLIHIGDAVQDREEAGAGQESADVRKLYLTDISEIKNRYTEIGKLLDEAIMAVMSL